MAIRCGVWELKRSFGHSCQQATLLANLLCKMGETACSSCFEQRGERQIKFTGLSFVTMFDLTELFTIGFKRRDLH